MSGTTHLPDTQEVLLDHLLVKLRHLSPGQEDSLIELLGEGLTNEELLQLLQSDQELGNAVQTLLSYQQNGSLTLGEAVFARVSRLDSELCAQLSGMLLEMPPLRLARLLQDEGRLREAVAAARAEYLRYTGASQVAAAAAGTTAPVPATREELAERLFAALHEQHPQLAGRLTGMLLELPEPELTELLHDRELLTLRTEQALRALGR
ncbi:polyadenylate-binding protein 1-A-like isoform X2 [Amphibalanus amphitrite]|uniref:polyadenylate-binding protein 1-A-like isoform X1 n=1 Tax=Amphibalanus amphitrite TaxID=1232801 RepID=UPI001C90EE10|nr:polyadenylate-binding protein 1-A-like isoform X1 [Amphibalanus amphitrite]XP_043188972.1 polyadenylate-binding protein 1-A-like isoform X2 [Amphibalanus amphitrite]